jgi:segregation and condensation protein B
VSHPDPEDRPDPAALPTPRRSAGAAPGPVEPAPVPVAELPAALEAILMVVDEPVDETLLAAVLDHPADRVRAVLEDLAGQYTAAGRGFDLRRVAGGWRFYTRPEHAAAVERFVLDGRTSRLTQAALETLAVVAYRQPVSRSRVAAVRGVNCDAVMRTLQTRGLIEECGTEAGSGALLYRTTTYFLRRMGLTDLAELPDLAPFLPDLDGLEEDAAALSGPARPAPGTRVAPGTRPGGDTGGDSPDGDRGGDDHGLDD